MILRYPLATEKCIRQIEFGNTLSFAIDPRATKKDVKEAVEKQFKVKVKSVNIDNSFTGKKKAYVKLAKEHSAADISADLGLL